MAITTSKCQIVSVASGVGAAALVVLGVYFGSGRLERFDSPLVAYAAATVFAAFGVTYRYAMWLQRPQTWPYFVASWRLFFRPASLARNVVRLIGLAWADIVAQTFIEKRSPMRWIAHLCIAWGCISAFLITFPLSWGWTRFDIAPNGVDYVVNFWGLHLLTFAPGGVVALLFYNGLNISAVLILVGIALAMHRRLFSRGAQAVQSLASDFVPLYLLFAVAVTGLMLTASSRLMMGSNYSFLSLLHAFTVVMLLLYLPFGKLFHVLQRPAQIGVAYYKEEGDRGAQAMCARSGEPYQSRMHHDDLVKVMLEMGLDFRDHQNLSPLEKRKLIALNQAATIEDRPFVG